MLQNRKKRLQKFFIIILLSALGTSLVLFSLNSKLDLFYSPSEMLAADIKPGYRIKLGGMVEIGSIQREGTTIFFVVQILKPRYLFLLRGLLQIYLKKTLGLLLWDITQMGCLLQSRYLLSMTRTTCLQS